MPKPAPYNPPFFVKLGLLICLVVIAIAHRRGDLVRATQRGLLPHTEATNQATNPTTNQTPQRMQVPKVSIPGIDLK